MMFLKTKHLLALFLCLPSGLALRGVRSSKKRSEHHDLMLEDQTLLAPQEKSGRPSKKTSENHDLLLEDQTLLAPKEKSGRFLEEEVPCVEIDFVALTVINHELSDVSCKDNGCHGGCCRSYYWLVCDRDNAFPDIPCVCNANTQDPANFDHPGVGGGNVTSAPTPSLPSSVGNSNLTDSAEDDLNITVISSAFEQSPAFQDEGWFLLHDEHGETVVIEAAVDSEEGSTSSDAMITATETKSPTFAPLTVSHTTPHPTLPPTIAPPSQAPVMPTPHPTVSPDACRDGSIYEGETGFDSYTACETSLDCVGMASISRNSFDFNTHDHDIVMRSETFKNKDKKKDRGDDEDDSNEGAAIVLPAQELGPPQVWCCLASMCLCGIPSNGDYYGRCVPPYVVPETPPPTATLSNTTNSTISANSDDDGADHNNSTSAQTGDVVTPTDPSEPPVSPQPVPVDTEDIKSENPTTAAGNVTSESETNTNGNLYGNATIVDDSGFIEIPTEEEVEVPETVCSDGSWYHENIVYSGFRTCVTSAECKRVDEEECCLVSFCFCGKVSVGDVKHACVPV